VGAVGCRNSASPIGKAHRLYNSSNGHISATDHPIDFVFDPRVGFSGTADRMDLHPVGQIQDGGWPPSWKISNGHMSGTGHVWFYGKSTGENNARGVIRLVTI